MLPDRTRPLRALHVYSGNLFGGVERLLVIFAQTAASRPGLAHEFALCFEGALSRALDAEGAARHRLAPVRLRRPWSVLRAQVALDRLLAASHYDVVVTHSYWPHALFAPVAARRGIPVALFAHDGYRGQHWTERLAALFPPAIVLSNSAFTAESLRAMVRAGSTPIEVYYGPVLPPDPALTGPARARIRAELGARDDEQVILLAARLERWKGHAALLEALARLRDLPGWRCWMTSHAQRPHEVAYLAELRETAARAGLDERVRFLGDRPDVPEVMAAADVHCQPNTSPEPFGRVFVEALYAGLTVVTTDAGGAREILGDDLGALVPAGDPARLSSALRRVLADPTFRADAAARGPERARALCGPETSLARLEALLARAARPPRPEAAAASRFSA